MAPRWSEEMTVRFVKLYREHECLWDQFNELYKSKSARTGALVDIAGKMNIDGFDWKEANRKIKALRATYHSEINKQLASEKLGTGEKTYTPTLKWFAEMKHIVDLGTLKAKTKSPAVTVPFTPPPQLKRNIDDDVAEIGEMDRAQGYVPEETRRPDRDSATIVHVRSPTGNSGDTPTRSKVRTDIRQQTPQNQSVYPPKVENEFEIFGRHVASQLKRLQVEHAVMAMGEINDVLTQKRLMSLLGHSGQHFAALPSTAVSSDEDMDMDMEPPT